MFLQKKLKGFIIGRITISDPWGIWTTDIWIINLLSLTARPLVVELVRAFKYVWLPYPRFLNEDNFL